MRRANKIALSMGSAALIVAGAVTAGPPVPYDQWTTNLVGGVTQIQDPAGAPLETTCPADFTCASAITGDGFLQRTLTDTSGNQYFQTIITDQGVSGAPSSLVFTDESYVRSGSANGGIAGRQRVGDNGITQPGTVLSTTNELNLGWAQTIGDPAPLLSLQQTLTQAAEGFSTGFSLTDTASASGGSGTNSSSRTMALDQSVMLDPANPAATDKQVFALRQVDATAAGSAGLPNGSTTAWAAGETISAIWLGQVMPSTSQVFGFQAFSNITTNAAPASFFSLSETGPWSWASGSVFGNPPAF